MSKRIPSFVKLQPDAAMLGMIFALFLVGIAGLLMVPKTREWVVEQIKAFSDAALMALLMSTSWFGRELTEEGREEQKMWRERRLRDLRNLGSKSGKGRSGQGQ